MVNAYKNKRVIVASYVRDDVGSYLLFRNDTMKALLGGMLLLCSLCVNAADAVTMTVAPNSPQFVVTFAANPTTGYQWVVTTYDKKVLKLTKSIYIPPQTKLMGAGGQMTFTFAPIKGKAYPSSTQMTFTYDRPWEHNNSGAVKQVTVNFK